MKRKRQWRKMRKYDESGERTLETEGEKSTFVDFVEIVYDMNDSD